MGRNRAARSGDFGGGEKKSQNFANFRRETRMENIWENSGYFGYNTLFPFPNLRKNPMSAIAMNLYDRLRNSGMADDSAREIAEIFDSQVREALRDAEKYADQSADKVRAESVPADEYHRRMENTPTRAENESQFEKLWNAINDLRREMSGRFDASNRLSYGILLAIFLLLLKDIAGF